MGRNQYFVGAISLLVLSFTISGVFCQEAPECQANCTLPACRCSGSDVPGNLTRAEVPQLVFLSFDAAVNEDNFAFYKDAFFNRTNPNNQPVTVTFFVSHDYTIYPSVHELWRKGHEIALHSISSNSSQLYWQSLNETGWRQEFLDQREQLVQFGRIPANDIKGVRAPQLQIGGDAMYRVLEQARIKYDASRPTQNSRVFGLWPYTNDYKSDQDCPIPRCPVESHPGFWSVPILNLVSQSNTSCSLADQCTPVPETADDTYDLLLSNFESHYNSHRSPFGIFTRHGWVNGTAGEGDEQILQRRIGYFRFLDYLGTLDDVYIVSIARGLEWVQSPTPLASVASFPAFQVEEKNSLCPSSTSCPYGPGQTPFKPPLSQERIFHTCTACPTAYPWVGNHLGRNPYV